MGRVRTYLLALFAAMQLMLGNGLRAEQIPTRTSLEQKIKENDKEISDVAPDKSVTFTPYFGVGYRTLRVGNSVDDYVEITRKKFDPSMPGFKDFMQLGKQLPYFTIGLNICPEKWHLWSRDRTEFSVSFDFSSSNIFGTKTDKETYDASVGAIHLGDTPSSWTQDLGFYGAWSAGLIYSPISLRLGNTKLSPLVQIAGGFSYIDSKSILHIHVNDDHPENNYPGVDWNVLNQVQVYQDIRTDAKTSGVGGFLDSGIGLALDFSNFNLQFVAGYRYEKIPSFKVSERTVSDGQLETKETMLEYDASGLNLKLGIGYKF